MLGPRLVVIGHGMCIWILHSFCFYRLLFAPGQQLLETTLASIRLTILTLRRGILVLFFVFGGVDILTRMAKARFVIALVTFHEDKGASLFARLKELWECNINVA